MARFNKTAHLRQNIEAIKVAFTLDRENRKATPEEIEILRAYSGFGAIKEVLDTLPAGDNKTKETPLTPLLRELNTVLKENTVNEREYKRYFDSIKNSILTAFYTPDIISHTIAHVMKRQGIKANRILDPSAGTGTFGHFQHVMNPEAEVTYFEKTR